MIESYRKAIPDHGVDRLEQELRALIGDLGNNLTDKINGLDVRVSTLEQTGTMAISAAVVNNDNRTISIAVIATDHTPGTSVTFNITDSNNNVATGSEVLVANRAGDKQLASTVIPIATLESGTLNVVATSTDEYGKTRTDTVIRTYSPVATALTVETVDVDFIQRKASISVNFNTGIPITDLLTASQAKLTITDSSNGNVIIENVAPSRGMSSLPVLIWDDVNLDTNASEININIDSVDAYGEQAIGERLNVDIAEINEAGVIITTGTANNETYYVNLEAVLWHSDNASATITNSGDSRTVNGNLATVVPYVGNDPDLDYTGAKKFTWVISAEKLAPETITATVNSTDTLGRSKTATRSIPYAPLGRLDLDWNSVNSAAKTLELIFDTVYISIGQTATVNLSSAVNGYSETHTVTVDQIPFEFDTIDLSGFPFGRINQQVTVLDRLGNTVTWDGFAMFADVQGSLTWASSGVSSASDRATARWKQTGVVTVDRVIATDVAGVSVVEDEIVTTPNDGSDVFKVDLDISTLRYGNITITVEGRDGANLPLTLTNVEQYTNEEGVLEVTSIEFNPNTSTMRIKGRYDNIKASTGVTGPIQFIHRREGGAGAWTTDELLWPENNVLRGFDKTLPYSYPDGQVIEYYLKSLDIKDNVVTSDVGTATTGSSGSISLSGDIDNVEHTLDLSASTNSSVALGSQITITISGAINLTSTMQVTSSTSSKQVTLPAIYGDITVVASVTDIYGEVITSNSLSRRHDDVNGGLTITEVSTRTPSSKVRVKGTVSNVANGSTVNISLMEQGSSTVRSSATATVSGGAFLADVVVTGGVANPVLPYGTITAKASVTDLGGSIVSDTKNGRWSAAAATINASVVSRDLVNGKVKIATSFTNGRIGSNLDTSIKVNGKTIRYGIEVSSINGSFEKTFDIGGHLDANNDIDYQATVHDYNGGSEVARINNIPWDNSSTISITSVTRPVTGNEVTVKGRITNVPSGWPVKAIGVKSNPSQSTSYHNGTTTAADTGGGAPFSITFPIKVLSNGTVIIKVFTDDQRGIQRTAETSHTWDGHGEIDVKDGFMSFPADRSVVVVDADLSNKWGATPNYKAELLVYNSDTDTSGTVVRTATFGSTSAAEYTLSWQDSNTLRARFFLSRTEYHGCQFRVRFSATDAAGYNVSDVGGDRGTLTNASKVSFPTSITTNGLHPQTGESLFRLRIQNHVPYATYGDTYPTITYTTPSGQTLSATPVFTNKENGNYYYSFSVADTSQSGTYNITAKLTTARSTASQKDIITTSISHVKEEPAELTTSSFYVRTRVIVNNIEVVDSIHMSGILDAANPANKTVYATLTDEFTNSSTFTDLTDSTGRWGIRVNGPGGLRIQNRTVLSCSAKVTYAGREIKAPTRSTTVYLVNQWNPS